MGVGEALIISSGLQLGTSIAAGKAAKDAGKEQQKLFNEQARIALSESKREAGRLRREHKISNAKLKLRFLKQGVAIQGSAANVIATDINLQDDQVGAVLASGEARSQLFELQGRIARNEGRVAFIGEVMGGVSSAVSSISMGFALGAFNKGTKFGTLSTATKKAAATGSGAFGGTQGGGPTGGGSRSLIG